MPRPFEIHWVPTGGYAPSAPLSGRQTNQIFAGLNMVLVGDGSRLEQWTGYGLFAASGNNAIATGSVAINQTDTVTGTSTKFLSELVPGQMVAIQGRVYSIFRIDSDTSMVVSPKTHATASGITMAILQQIQTLDTKIATMLRGSIIRLPNNALMGAGRGPVRLNGAVLPGGGWTLTDHPSIAVYDVLTQTFTPYRLGMKTPTLTTVTPVVGGGVKGMPAGNYSLRIVPFRFATKGYNNPSEAIAVTLATAGDRIQPTFPAMETLTGQDGWQVYGTKSTSSANAMMGDWFLVRTLTTTEVPAAGGTFILEWADGELIEQLRFDNDPPPPASFMASLGGLPIAVGCLGMGHQLTGTVTVTNGNATITGAGTQFTTELGQNRFVWLGSYIYRVVSIASATSMDVYPTPVAAGAGAGQAIRSASEAPGPMLFPANVSEITGGYNYDAYSPLAAVAIDPPDPILGCYQVNNQLWLLTANGLAIGERNTDSSTSSTNPLVTRPFWNIGFRNPRAIVAVDGYIYAFTTNGATRSADFGDKVETQHAFAAAVAPDMALWDAGKVTVAYNQQFEAVCFMHADDGTRPSGTARYGTMLMYQLQLGLWSPPLRMEDLSDVDPTYATSTATIQGKMFFASPTNLGVTNIYELAVVNGEVGETFIAPNFMTDAPGMDHQIRRIALKAGRTSAANALVDVYGTVANGDAPVADLQAGTNSLAQKAYTLGQPVRSTFAEKFYVNRLQDLTVRVKLSTSGSVGARLDRLDVWGNVCEILR